ncbi:MAG: HoxN/HupN/NixA family nickel/cobalt transporter [Aeromicrobium sp.]
MGAFIVFLHVAGWGLLVLAASRGSQSATQGALGLGLGVTAYTLGMRHAFDVDHIAAIDNTTRTLLSDRQATERRPLSVGFWFSLGHSSIVLGLCLLLALGVRTLSTQLQDESSTLQQTAAVIGTSVSGFFLLLIGIINAVVLAGIVTVARSMRRGDYDEHELDEQLARRGFMNRILRRVTRTVSKPWHMYPVGALFGLGLDTATEVSLLVLASGAAALSLPWYSLLVLPILFAAGMSLLDTIDGVFMGYAYDWAFLRPARKVYYNLVVTALSVVVALMIGGIEILGLFGLGSMELDDIGYLVFAVFAATWLVAVVVWRMADIEDRWGAAVESR